MKTVTILGIGATALGGELRLFGRGPTEKGWHLVTPYAGPKYVFSMCFPLFGMLLGRPGGPPEIVFSICFPLFGMLLGCPREPREDRPNRGGLESLVNPYVCFKRVFSLCFPLSGTLQGCPGEPREDRLNRGGMESLVNPYVGPTCIFAFCFSLFVFSSYCVLCVFSLFD